MRLRFTTGLHFALCTRRFARGTALIETAIVLPLYMLILLGVIYFGYAGLTKQRQGAATAYGAWLPSGAAQAVELLTDFWPWAGTAQGTAAQATAGDTTLALPENRIRVGDEYYGSVIPSLLASGAHSLGGGGDDVFDLERVTVQLWNYALGHTIQSFNWTPGQGAVQQMNTTWDDFSRYLNVNAGPTGFVTADAFDPPQIGPYQIAMTAGLDGSTLGTPWLQRRTVLSQATYNPPFFPQIFSDATAPPNTSFTNYISGNYPTPAFVPTATQRFDVTGRDPNVFRLAAGEAAPPSDAESNRVRDEAGTLVGGSLPDPIGDQTILGLPTVKGSWSAN